MMMTTTRSSMSVKPDSSFARRLRYVPSLWFSFRKGTWVTSDGPPRIGAAPPRSTPLDRAIRRPQEEVLAKRVKVACCAADEREVCRTPFRSTTCSSTRVALGASDLHITVGSAPVVRVRGKLVALEGTDELDAETTQTLLYRILSTEQQKRLELDKQIDLAHAVPGVARFRVNVYFQRESIGAAFRQIPQDIKSLEELGLPSNLHDLTKKPRGLVLVTGPTGSGKSTTLAALIDEINRTRAEHILTIEDPVEFVHRHKRCIVNQREIGVDATGFGLALRAALRQDPDVILVGEMRDLETIGTALTAAETGHLVFGTLHTQSAPSTIDRIIDVFPAVQQEQIRVQLASTLQGVVTQTLLPTADGTGRVAALEVLFPDDAVRNLIRQGKVEQIYSVMQTNTSRGMQTLEQSLAELTLRKVITKTSPWARRAAPRSSRRCSSAPASSPTSRCRSCGSQEVCRNDGDGDEAAVLEEGDRPLAQAEAAEGQATEGNAAEGNAAEAGRAKRAKGGGSDAQRIVGLKIGASQLAAATVSNNGAAELLQVARHDLTPGIVVGGELREPEKLSEALQEFFDEERLCRSGTCASASRTTASASARSTSRAWPIRRSSTTRFASARRRRCRFRSRTQCSTTTSSARRPITRART